MTKRAFIFALSVCIVISSARAGALGRDAASARAGFASTVYTPPKVTASVKPYVVAPNLANVTNLRRMSAAFRFTPDQRAMLQKNGFVVTPSSEEQLFFIYEN